VDEVVLLQLAQHQADFLGLVGVVVADHHECAHVLLPSGSDARDTRPYPVGEWRFKLSPLAACGGELAASADTSAQSATTERAWARKKPPRTPPPPGPETMSSGDSRPGPSQRRRAAGWGPAPAAARKSRAPR